jgi:hypothetical protein
VVSVFPNSGRKMHTTRSWEFMGLERAGEVPQWSPWEVARYGEDTIIGNVDSGVWPESLSFNDGEMGPIQDTWKGICQNEHDPEFKCNRCALASSTPGPRQIINCFSQHLNVFCVCVHAAS